MQPGVAWESWALGTARWQGCSSGQGCSENSEAIHIPGLRQPALLHHFLTGISHQ